MQQAPSMTTEIIDGQHVIIVKLSEQMVDAAMLTGQLIHTVARGKLKEWIKSNPDWRTAGFMGQLACALYFYGEWRQAFEYVTIAKGDCGDLKFGNFIINVITRTRLYEGVNYAIIDMERFKVNPYPLYIACSKANKDKIIIWGYATWDEVKRWDHDSFGEHYPSYYKPLNELHSIDLLKDVFKHQLQRHKLTCQVKATRTTGGQAGNMV